MAVYPESPWIASGGADGTVKLWSIEKPDQPSISLAGHQLDVENLVFLDKNQLISTSSDRKAILWDLSILKLDSLIHLTCDWWQDYLQTGPGLTDSERQLCQ